MEDYKFCRYCEYAIYIPVERRVMCKRFGLVPRDHVCSEFFMDPFKIKVKRPENFDFSKYENEDYSIE